MKYYLILFLMVICVSLSFLLNNKEGAVGGPKTGGAKSGGGGGSKPVTGGGTKPVTGGGPKPVTGGGSKPVTGGTKPVTGGGGKPVTGGGGKPVTGGGSKPVTGGGLQSGPQPPLIDYEKPRIAIDPQRPPKGPPPQMIESNQQVQPNNQEFDYLESTKKQTTSPSTWIPTSPAPTSEPFYKGTPARTSRPLRVANSNPTDKDFADSKQAYDKLANEMKQLFGILMGNPRKRIAYFDYLCDKSFFTIQEGPDSGKLSNPYFESLSNYGTPIEYKFLRDEIGTQTSGPTSEKPEIILIWIPESGPPIKLMEQVVKEFLEGQKLFLDDIVNGIINEARSYGNVPENKYKIGDDSIMYLRKTVDYIKNNIDSYFKIENNFKNYVENVHTRAWPDKKPTGKQLVDMNDASERLKEMRRIYKERIYELCNSIINNEKTLFDMKQGEYESQDTSVLQNKIIRTVELNLTDRPFRKGGKGVPDIQPIKGDVTKLNELAANIKTIYLTYPNNKTLEKYYQESNKIIKDTTNMINNIKSPGFIDTLITTIEPSPAPTTLSAAAPFIPTSAPFIPSSAPMMSTSAPTFTPAIWSPNENPSINQMTKPMIDSKTMDESKMSIKRFRDAYRYLYDLSNRITSTKSKNWDINGILNTDMIYNYDTGQKFKFYPDNGGLIEANQDSNTVNLKIPEKEPPIETIKKIAYVCLQGMKTKSEDSLKTINNEVKLYPNNDYSMENIEFKLENAVILNTNINEYINGIPDSSLEKYAYDVYYTCWSNKSQPTA